jgi:Protein of unknown function (DUF3800)
MHILYLDDSGSVENPNERFFILGGVSVFERGIYHLIEALDETVRGFDIGDPADVELHGNPMYQGKTAPWKSVPRPKRVDMMNAALGKLGPKNLSVRLFGVAVDREAVSPRDPVQMAFEEICNRFNLYLMRRNNRSRPEDGQRGLIVMDESKHEKPLQTLARHFRVDGTRWGQLRNLAEVPLFVDSRASRLVQLADLVAYSLWRRYEYSDGRFFDGLIPYFDSEGGVIHGLVHHKARSVQCFCPACLSRAQTG